MQGVATLQSNWATDTGLVRSINTDTLIAREPRNPLERVQKGHTWVLADGVGGDERAQNASKLASHTVSDAYWESAIPDAPSRLRAAVERANSVLWGENATGDEAASAPFAATILAIAIIEQTLLVAHAGRSRAYLYRNGRLRQITNDHTWVAQAVEAGEISAEEALTHPRRNVITRCLGIGDRVEVDIALESLEPGDLMVLTSDGVARSLEDETLASMLSQFGLDTPQAIASEARNRGGADNVTIATIAIENEGDQETVQTDRIALLSRFSYELARSPALDATLDSVLERLLMLSGGERAAIMLLQQDGTLSTRIARSLRGGTGSFEPSHTVAEKALAEQRPVFVTDSFDDAAYSTSESIIAMSLRSILCVPMIAHDRSVGVLYVDSTSGQVAFSESDLELLVAFGSHAAAALQNARLHAELVDRMHDIEHERRHKEVLIRSLSSALVAVDGHGVVTEWNPMAAEVLGVPASEAIGAPFFGLLPMRVASWLQGLVVQAESGDQTVMYSNDWEGEIGARKRVILAGRVGRIRDPDEQVSGYVFVLNDRTDAVMVEEARRAERQEQLRLRDLFSRYFAPPVVERLLNTPGAVELGGTRHEVAILFVDVRGFTGLSEQSTPEDIVRMLNSYLELATIEIFEQLGTLDKFLGDGVMAIFGAPVDVQNRELAAIRAAVSMSARINELRQETGLQVGFGIGLHAGEAIVGNIGTTQLMSYTAIGDVVNVAARLESEARTGEILISGEMYDRVSGHVEVEELGSIYLKGRLHPIRVLKVLRMLDSG